MNLLKKLGVSSYLTVVVFIFSLIGLILYVQNSELLYFRNLNGTIVLFTILSMVIVIGTCVASFFVGDKWYFIVPQVAAAIFLTIAFVMSIIDRSTAMGYAWFSKLEANNPQAISALNGSVVFWVMYAISLTGIIVSAFFDYQKKEIPAQVKDTETVA